MTHNGAPAMPQPWLDDPRLDPELLAHGDSRNVEDRYRYWTVEAIQKDLRASSVPLEIAVENLERDFNMGTIVRNANAFNVRRVHVVGRRQWNRRGAMKTDMYLDVVYHATVQDFLRATVGKQHIAVDNVESSASLETVTLPEQAVLVFGAEGPGLSQEMLAAADTVVAIPQFGSTRSVNVGVASGILIYKWVEQHILLKK